MKLSAAIAVFFLCVFSLFAQGPSSERSLYAELKPYFPRAQVRFFDKRYETISSAMFINDFLPAYSHYLSSRGLRGIDAGFSEKHYAELCKNQLQIWLMQRYRRGVEVAAAVLVTDTKAKKNNSALPSGWLLIRLDDGWQVFDAARFTLVPLSSFQYADRVMAVQF